MRFKNFSEAFDYLRNFTDYERMTNFAYSTSVLGLERMWGLLKFCGNPHTTLRTLHIAGTKGKGSTALMASEVLSAHGLKVGLYTSPHLQDARERIQISGTLIPGEHFAHLLNQLYPYLEESREKKEVYKPTFFEIMTVVSFLYFREEGVDVAVYEAGLGGRLDATNVIIPVACAITRIDFDHTDKLGGTLPSIAGEKAGILKSGVPVIVAPQEEEALSAIENQASRTGSPLLLVGRDISVRNDGELFTVGTPNAEYPSLRLSLLGQHQRLNSAVAIALCEFIRELNPEGVRSALARIRIPGRIELFSEDPLVIIDGAHNTASTRVLVNALRENFSEGRNVFVVGVMRDKDVEGILRILSETAGEFIFVRTNSPRSAEPQELLGKLRRFSSLPASCASSVGEAIDRALSRPQKLICVTGSFYLAGEARSYLEERFGGRPAFQSPR